MINRRYFVAKVVASLSVLASFILGKSTAKIVSNEIGPAKGMVRLYFVSQDSRVARPEHGLAVIMQTDINGCLNVLSRHHNPEFLHLYHVDVPIRGTLIRTDIDELKARFSPNDPAQHTSYVVVNDSYMSVE